MSRNSGKGFEFDFFIPGVVEGRKREGIERRRQRISGNPKPKSIMCLVWEGGKYECG